MGKTNAFILPRPRPFFIFLVSLLVAIALGGCSAETDSWPRIEESGVLRVGLDPTFPPFEVADETGVAGLDVDLAHALADDLGLSAEFVYFGYDGLYDALTTEQVDVLISALVIQPERTRDFAYSEPYFNAGQILIVPATSAETDITDFAGKTLAVELGAQGHVEATQWTKRIPDLTVLPMPSAEEALATLTDDPISAEGVLIDSVSGRLFLKDHPELKRLPSAVTVEPYALVVRSEDRVLLQNLNQSLQRLSEAGTLDAIVDDWLGG